MIFKYKKSNFSLIELLAVLVISGIVLGLTLPALNTLMTGQSVEQAAINFSSELKAVRSFAITNREYLALIIPTTESGIASEYKYKSYRPCIVDINNDFQFWIADNKWEFLPTGTAILSVTQDLSPTIKDFTKAALIDGVDFTLIGGSGNTDDVMGLVFKPNGQSLGLQTYVQIGNAVTLDGASAESNHAYIKIDQFTGRISYGSE